jgi:hypothetical protein
MRVAAPSKMSKGDGVNSLTFIGSWVDSREAAAGAARRDGADGVKNNTVPKSREELWLEDLFDGVG